MPWTARYHFKTSKPFTSEDKELTLNVGGRDVTISGTGDAPLKECSFLTLNAHDLEDENAAWTFGRRIADALLLAGIRRDIGIDGGEDEATFRLSKAVVDKMEEHGGKFMPNVHGLSVYERTGNEFFLQFDAKASVTQDPKMFFDELKSCFGEVEGLGEREQTALALIALSKLAREPLAEATLCISAVEYLSADTPWTSAQLKLLGELKSNALSSPDLSPAEAHEVADGIGRIFRSIRQSIKRKVKSLGLSDEDWKLFDDVYSLRSKIFHGSIVGKKQHVELASRARVICARVVLAAEQSARSNRE